MTPEEYKCPFVNCKDYLELPVCQNHAHVLCDNYLTERQKQRDLDDIERNYIGKLYDDYE